MSYLFTSESVSEGHPDKVSDQVSDAMLDAYLSHDPNSKVACETFCTTGLVLVGGEITSKGKGKVDVEEVVRGVVRKIGYTKASYRFDADSCAILNTIHGQSPDILQGVEDGKGLHKEQGAGDQGMMFGYANIETENYMPLPLMLSHAILRELADIRREGKVMTYLRPDSKSQVTIEYNDRGRPESIHTIVVSTQHDDFITPDNDSPEAVENADRAMLEIIRNDVRDIVLRRILKKSPYHVRRLFGRGWQERIKLHVNPTGKFVIGGPHGDVGLTGRKIIVDTYGGYGAHGGGAFSGKDSSKVDRSAAYAARHIAKNIVASGLCTQALVQVAYAIGLAQPVSINVNTFRTCKQWRDGKKMSDSQISETIAGMFDMRPAAIVERFGLKNPIFSDTAAYGHFGREVEKREVEVFYEGKDVTKRVVDGETRYFKTVETFGWERLDRVNDIVKAFNLEEVKETPYQKVY
ncbi:MAG: methionine adenosyltransferase [Flavobacteriales bacterium]|nr:methionine adenosyltransferase [Flavobacteriales bacterium]